ncbi:MAG: hypothetical protein GQ569_07260, partial [Methylococcaceae bacterium]|nr:hypothetical protein [Methylococcaceae bacterium]
MSFSFSSLWQRKGLRICSYIGLGFIGFLFLILALLQFPPLQRQLAQSLSESLSDEETFITLSPIEGFLPFTLRFDEFSIADKQGVWLKLEKVELAWSFTALLTGEILVRELGAKHLLIERLPPSKEKTEPDEPIEIPTSLPDLEIDLMRVNIHHLGIDKIELGKAVLGQPLSLNFTADA